MDIELVKASLQRLRERRAAIPAMRDYKPQRGKASKEAAPAVDVSGMVGRLSKLFSSPDEGTKEGGEK